MNEILNQSVVFKHLGLIDYKEAWNYQTTLFDGIIATKVNNRKQEAKRPTVNYLLFCQHPHVYTLGKSGDDTHLLADQQKLLEIGADFYRINRGGDITYHGPGQIVGYPVLDLENFFTDIHKYLRLLEEAVIATLAEFNIAAGRIEGLTGVWIDHDGDEPRKICALGVKTSRWVTMHGFAFNVNTDLTYFEHIVPCGIDDKAVTSMERELGTRQDLQKVEEILKIKIASLFSMKLNPAPHDITT